LSVSNVAVIVGVTVSILIVACASAIAALLYFRHRFNSVGKGQVASIDGNGQVLSGDVELLSIFPENASVDPIVSHSEYVVKETNNPMARNRSRVSYKNINPPMIGRISSDKQNLNNPIARSASGRYKFSQSSKVDSASITTSIDNTAGLTDVDRSCGNSFVAEVVASVAAGHVTGWSDEKESEEKGNVATENPMTVAFGSDNM
jgi:hypothetical protein